MNTSLIHLNIYKCVTAILFIVECVSSASIQTKHDISQSAFSDNQSFCGTDMLSGLGKVTQHSKEVAMRETTQCNAAQESLPKAATIVRSAKRTNMVNSRNKQRVLVIADVSGSMAGVKAQQAHAGCQQLNNALGAPENRNGFITGVIFFNEDARIAHPWTAAAALVGNITPLNPSGYTNIDSAFDAALKMLKEVEKQDSAQKDVNYLRPIAFLYSDGQTNTGSDPRAKATELKVICDLVTVAIGDDSDQKLLAELATSPAHAYTVPDTDSLRKFLADAGPTVVGSFLKGDNATVVATQIKAH